jgi:transposase
MVENGCKWRRLPESHGNWHTLYVRANRWSKKGVFERVFARPQEENIISIRVEVLSMDSTSIKVHPDGTGALKKRQAIDRQKPRRLDNKATSGCRE